MTRFEEPRDSLRWRFGVSGLVIEKFQSDHDSNKTSQNKYTIFIKQRETSKFTAIILKDPRGSK
jgi:hypothetical protein